MIRTEILLEAAGGRSAISRQAPVPLFAECALLRRKRTAELANRIPLVLGRDPPDFVTRVSDLGATCRSESAMRF